MDRSISPLAVSTDTTGRRACSPPTGVLDSSTYLRLRDAIVQAALDEPQAVFIDINRLDVPASSAWTVFTSARWLVDTWPAVPIHLVCGHADRRNTIARNGVTRYVRVHSTVEAALGTHSLTFSRASRGPAPNCRPHWPVCGWPANSWRSDSPSGAIEDLIPVATVVVNVFVENVLQHTGCGPVLLLETDGQTVTLSVQDDSSTSAVRHEDPCRGGRTDLRPGDRRLGVPRVGQRADPVGKDGLGAHRSRKIGFDRVCRAFRDVSRRTGMSRTSKRINKETVCGSAMRRQ